MQRKYKLVMIVVISLFLIGGASIAIIKEVEHLRIERQNCQGKQERSQRASQSQTKDRIVGRTAL